ncbi:hypothetical protein LQ318_05130 [Aliifodinibius salicampi]|uniref:Outer membrane protein beta-barrel domain-containing protein n=1 Tax=Fodinibius salicampi TaxID=1920655 RepID=A0ABT3PWR0_9BACT|nr:TorF family putative porin [Fodinibius salicampi]MCW9712285.1 hypothetical protein [Fodinibius salicampi]
MTNFTKINTIKYFLTALSILFVATGFQTVKAQDDGEVNVSTGVDIYSTYVWRGVAYAGPSLQPYVELGAGGFTLGAWGSQGIDGLITSGTASNGFQEMDLYTAYSFDFGLSLGVTDYYYPGTLFFEEDSHAFELNGGYTVGDLSLSANYIFAGGGSVGDDVYFQLGYDVGQANLFIGGGDGWHSTDTEFTIVNIGIGTSKEIEITDSFSLPVSGAVILNPDTEQFYITAGISL